MHTLRDASGTGWAGCCFRCHPLPGCLKGKGPVPAFHRGRRNAQPVPGRDKARHSMSKSSGACSVSGRFWPRAMFICTRRISAP